MAKVQKKLQKNMKKVIIEKEKKYPLKTQVINFSKIIYLILILAIIIYFLTVVINKTYKLDSKESLFDESQILASQTFSKLEDTYYVVLYDFNDNDNKNITEAIANVRTSTIYKVDLGLANNKYVLSSNSNKNASSADELKVTGPTLIKIEKAKNIEYIDGLDNVVSYLKEL